MLLKKMKIGQKMLLGFGLITVLMLSVLGYAYINFTKQSANVDLNLHTYNVIRASDTILISLINMETGSRGFAFTGKEEFLEPFNQGKIDYKSQYSNLKQLTTDNYRQQDRLDSLNNSHEIWLQWVSSQIVEFRRKVNIGEAKIEDLIVIAQSGKGKQQMDNSRKIIQDIINEEQDLLKTRNNNLLKMEKQTVILLFVGGVLVTLLTVIISILLVRMIVNPIVTVTNTFKEISEGDADLEVRLMVSSNDELGDMSRYFNTFMTKLTEMILDNKNQSWLKTGEAELSEKIRGEQDLVPLSTNIITYIAKYINAQIGVVYVKTKDDTFNFFGSYAYNPPENLSKEIKLGEGIIGQAALEKRTIVITNVPDYYIKIASGLGASVPRNILVTPFIYENEVLGIIELGSFNEFTEMQLKFIKQISSSIAITIHSAEVRLKMKELLHKTMVQSEELQSQQEELRQNNEELEEHTKSLKKSEAHLKKQQQELSVVNEALEEKAKALEITSKYKSEFLANMSHELRTPLNSILVLSQMLAGNKDAVSLSAKQLEFAKTIHSSGGDLLKLINDILDLSKVEAGKMEVNFEKIFFTELEGYVDSLFRPVAAQKGLYFKVEIQDGLPKNILSDMQRVQQILNNLLSNAIKFTSNGGITMSVHSIKEHGILNFQGKTEKFIGISITDTGIGVPHDKQALIFEAFKQSDGTTSRKYGGTGLGLSISKELAGLLGGSIHLVSEVEKGSTFTLILPYQAEKGKLLAVDIEKGTNTWQVEENIIENIIENNEVIETKNIDDRRIINAFEKYILIIEDDKKFASILVELAHEKGYKCLIAENGLTGIDLAMKYKPDAILLDIGLPDISGWKVVEKLKGNSETKNITVHVISGGDHYNSKEKVNSVLGYLKKPVSVESLDVVFMEIQNSISKPLKKVLIVDENKADGGNIVKVLSEKGFQITLLDSGIEAYNILKTELFDCLIMDLKSKDISGFQLLAKLDKESIENLQIIIYTENELSWQDELELQKYAQSIIIKGTRSAERLVSEVSLFLHDLDSKIEEKKIKVIKTQHEKEDALNNKKILVVDDDMRNIFALTSVLEEKGIKVVVGRNGEEAIKKLYENLDIDLILMDIMMPDMDGYTAIRAIRKQEGFHKTPILAITAKAMKDDKQKCIDAGADDYLTKPIDMDKLISLLRVWLYK
ncbi:response regulator [Clostridium sp. CF012]|uniref:response regulator n=1 Tax=Clostridium sp. CF012 TaxID=2843319 RepID=UPI001C0DCC2F|nr:response regulator [Clostridium sp. CF012]MBU3144591.1 response regulator [Clostridium sp. CF012]